MVLKGRQREARFAIEGIEARVSGFSKEKCLVTGSKGTTGVVIEVKGEQARDGDEERVIAVEEVIMLDEGTRGVEEEEV